MIPSDASLGIFCLDLLEMDEIFFRKQQYSEVINVNL